MRAWISVSGATVFFLSLLSGCGVKFNDIPNLNKPLDGNMLGRNVIEDPEIMKRHLDQIPGVIIYEKSDGTFSYKEPLPLAKLPVVNMLAKDDKHFYHSIIDSKAGAQGSYLGFAAQMDAKYKCEVTIDETAEVFVNNDDLPKEKMRLIANTPKPPDVKHRFLVQGALLTTLTQLYFTEISANGTVSGGLAFGAEGKVYATNAATTESVLARIGAHLIDIDDYFTDPKTSKAMNVRIQKLEGVK